MAPKYNSFRLFEFGVKDVEKESDDDELTKPKHKKDNLAFSIQMFGKNEKGKTCSVIVREFNPFFYIKIPESWGIAKKLEFINHMKEEVLGDYFKDGLLECKLVKRKKLYGFDGRKQHKFLVLKFANMRVFYKARSLWYNKQRKLHVYKGFQREPLVLYEANILPLLPQPIQLVFFLRSTIIHFS